MISLSNSSLLAMVALQYCCSIKTLKQIQLLQSNHILLKHTCSRSYRLENTGSRPITAIKLNLAELVLGWDTTKEYFVS